MSGTAAQGSPIAWLSRRLQGRFLRDTATLQVGSVINAAGNLGSTIALAHVLGAHEQGRYYVALALYALLWFLINQGPVSATVSQIAAARARGLHDKIAPWLAFLAKAYLVIGILLFGLGWVALPSIARFWGGSGDESRWAWWLAITPILELPRVVACAALQGTRRMLPFTQIENTQEATRVFLVIVGALVTSSGAGAILGTLCASLIGSVVAIEVYRGARATDPEGLPSVREIAGHVRDVPLRRGFPLGFKLGLVRSIDALATQVLPSLILRYWGGSYEWVSYLRIAQRILSVPLLLMQGISRNLLPALSELAGLRDMARFKRLFVRASLTTGAVISAGMIVCLPLIHWAVRRAFPHEYHDPVWTIALILLPGFVIMSFSIANDTFYLVTNTLRAGVVLCVIGLFVNTAVVATLARLWPTTGVAVGLSFTMATATMHYAYAFWWFRRAGRASAG
jgi:O-antigen/teichoic acid export membrane protein